MNKILLDYVFPISSIEPSPAASTLFLKQVCVVAKPAAGQEANVGNIYECVNMAAVAVRTANTNAQQLFNAGMNRVYVLLANDLDLDTPLSTGELNFFTLLISDDFDDDDLLIGVITPGVAASLKVQDILYTAQDEGVAGNDITIAYIEDAATGNQALVTVVGTDIVVDIDVTATTAATIASAIEADEDANALVSVEVDDGDETDIQTTFAEDALEGGVDEVTGEVGMEVGTFPGVVGVSTQSTETAAAQAVIENRAAFYGGVTHKAKNMFFAFGSLLSNYVNWLNQQYITMPYTDEVTELGTANSFFDDKVSFVLTDSEFGNRLALFAAGGKAIAAPYIIKNLQIEMQSKAIQWIAANQPQYTRKEAALLETRLQEDVINLFISRSWITAGIVSILLEQDNFVATGDIDVSQPKALWRVFSELRQTL